MRNTMILLRRELTAVFLSPIAYVTSALYTSATAWTFLATVRIQTGQQAYPEALFFVALLVWLPFLITVISMRLFAEEKRNGTLETLMTTAVSETSIVIAKYVGAVMFCWISVAPAFLALKGLVMFSPGIPSIDTGALTGGVSLLLLVSLCCTAIGVLVSLLTRNQIVAAIACFWAIFLPFMVQPLMRAIPLFRFETVLRYSLEEHVTLFVSGTLSLQPAVLYLSIACFMLFAAIRILEARRWFL